MATTQFNARNGLSVGTTPVSILDASGNASFTSASVAAGLVLNSGTSTNNNIEIGSTNAASNPYIDFHSGATSTDYDSRIIASGGTGVGGDGTLTIKAGNLTLNAPVSVTNTTASTSKTTGSLVVGGGVGIAGDVYATTFYGSGAGLTSIPNSALTNSSVTIGTTNVALGGTATSLSGLGTVTGTSFNSITGLSSATPSMNGTATVGTSSLVAHGDHIHPTDTTRQAAYTLLTTFGSLASAAGWLYNNGSGTLSYSSPTKSTVGLANVENTALSTWVGTSNITTLGTVATGIWHGTAIADAYIASAATWTAKQAAYTILTTFGSLANSAGWLYNNGSGTLSYSTPTAAQVGADASGAATSAVSTHAALQTGVHGISVTSGKTFSCSNTLTLAGTDSSTLNIGAGGTLGTGAFTAAYSLPTATSSVLGGVKPDGTSILNLSGVLSATPTSIGALASATNDNATSTACYPVWVTAAGNTVSGISASTFTFIPSTGTLNITTLQATGNVIAYNSSDSRLKENIAPLDSPLEKLSKIRGVSFDWTDAYIAKQGGEDGFFVRKHDVGVIAQEIQKVIPEAVGEHPDGYLGVRYEKLVPLLIEAIKAQQVQIDDLKKQIARLA